MLIWDRLACGRFTVIWVSTAKGSRTEQSRPCSVGEKESLPSMTTACLSGAACLQLRWNQGEICAALIMSLV